MYKRCSICHSEKSIKEFYKNGRDKNGQIAYRNECKECYNIIRKVKYKDVSKFISHMKVRTGEECKWTIHDWRDALLYFRGEGAYCGVKQSRRVKLTKDHIVPVVKGGLTERANVIPSCVTCNSSKSDRDLGEWYTKQPFYSAERLRRIVEWQKGGVKVGARSVKH